MKIEVRPEAKRFFYFWWIVWLLFVHLYAFYKSPYVIETVKNNHRLLHIQIDFLKIDYDILLSNN